MASRRWQPVDRRRRDVGLLLWLSLLFLVTGIFAPTMTLRKFVFFENHMSIYSGLISLFEDGQLGLFAIILLFSVCFPLVKLFVLSLVWFGEGLAIERRRRLHAAVEVLGKWSMLDVFVVSILVVMLKIGVIADVEVHYGIYVFAASVLLGMIASVRLKGALVRD